MTSADQRCAITSKAASAVQSVRSNVAVLSSVLRILRPFSEARLPVGRGRGRLLLGRSWVLSYAFVHTPRGGGRPVLPRRTLWLCTPSPVHRWSDGCGPAIG